jgi:hypothetical protein
VKDEIKYSTNHELSRVSRVKGSYQAIAGVRVESCRVMSSQVNRSSHVTPSPFSSSDLILTLV